MNIEKEYNIRGAIQLILILAAFACPIWTTVAELLSGETLLVAFLAGMANAALRSPFFLLYIFAYMNQQKIRELENAVFGPEEEVE